MPKLPFTTYLKEKKAVIHNTDILDTGNRSSHSMQFSHGVKYIVITPLDIILNREIDRLHYIAQIYFS